MEYKRGGGGGGRVRKLYEKIWEGNKSSQNYLEGYTVFLLEYLFLFSISDIPPESQCPKHGNRNSQDWE